MRGIWGKRGRGISSDSFLTVGIHAHRMICNSRTVNAMAKQSKTLSLDEDAVKRGEQYSKLHNTNISELVNRFLSALPVGEEDENKFSPTVRRLIGVAPDGDAVQEYHEHLLEKYDR